MALALARRASDPLAATSRKLLPPMESAALLLQSTNLAISAFEDKYKDGAVFVVYGLSAIHLLAAILSRRFPGPLTRGGIWQVAWLGMMFLMPLLAVNLLQPGEYGGFGHGLQLGNYTLIPLAVLAFYPWDNFARPARRWAIEIGLIVAVVVEPIIIVGASRDWQLTFTNYKSLIMYAVWAVVWYLVGKGIAKLCEIAVKVERDALTSGYDAVVRDIHSYAEITALRIEQGDDDPKAAADLLRERMIARRNEILYAVDRPVKVVDIIDGVMSLFGSSLNVLSLPYVGLFTLPRGIAQVLERCLLDLLKNAVEHGGGQVHVDLAVHRTTFAVTVRDLGLGVNPAVLDIPGGNLHSLREDARRIKGELECVPSPGPGAILRLTLPRQRDT